MLWLVSEPGILKIQEEYIIGCLNVVQIVIAMFMPSARQYWLLHWKYMQQNEARSCLESNRVFCLPIVLDSQFLSNSVYLSVYPVYLFICLYVCLPVCIQLSMESWTEVALRLKLAVLKSCSREHTHTHARARARTHTHTHTLTDWLTDWLTDCKMVSSNKN